MEPPLPPRWAPGSFLARLSPEQVAELLQTGVRHHFEPGRPLLWEGDPSTHVEILVRGFVKITILVDGIEVLVGIRVSGDGNRVFISDEYGPHVYEFDRWTGARVRSFALPTELAVPMQSPQGDVEISGNTVGRVANKAWRDSRSAPRAGR